MPPRIKYTKEQIVDAGVELVREGGIAALNARALAGRLGCSTQPIFREFSGMEEVKAAVIKQAEQIYNGYIQRSASKPGPNYKATGLAYIDFAREEGALFQLLFMRDRRGEVIPPRMTDDNMEYIMQTISTATGLTGDQAYDFHLHMWIYAHGLASMVATHFADFTEEEAGRLLGDEFKAFTRRYETQ